MGITRLGNITGLDRIGIPVAIAVRPNSRSVSVSQGKGLELPQAMASALMEACEGFHAEEIGPRPALPLPRARRQARPSSIRTVVPGGAGRSTRAAISWIEGYDLLQREPCWVPRRSCTPITRASIRTAIFLAGSNGLASGNHLVEAINAALYELVERDAVALWIARPILRRAQLRARSRLGRRPGLPRRCSRDTTAARIAVRVWNVTTDIGIAAFLCEIRDTSAGDPQRLRRFHGSGCHADRAVALSRALTEAAQTRLTYIAGIRDDLSPASTTRHRAPRSPTRCSMRWRRRARRYAFREVPSFAADDLRRGSPLGVGPTRAQPVSRAPSPSI